MEQRQTQVQVGAGLQESRLNTDLINFLQKYGSWAVYALLAVVLGYLGLNYLERKQEENRDAAFADYRSATSASSPASLVDTATKHEGTTVASMSRIEAVRLYVDSARRGLKPGTDLAAPKPEDKLDEAGKRQMMADADKLIDAILGDKAAPAALKQQARWFRAGVQADGGDIDGAIRTMQELESQAKALGFADQEIKAKERIAHLGKLKNIKPIFAKADLPESAREPDAPAPAAGGPISATATPMGGGEMGEPRILNAPPGVQIQKMTPEEVEKAMGGRKFPESSSAPKPVDPTVPSPAPAPAADPKPAEPKPN